MGAMKQLAIRQADANAMENAEIVRTMHRPEKVARLVSASRRMLDVMQGQATPAECKAAYEELWSALLAFPEEPEALSPLLSLYTAPPEPVPPGGGKWASAREYREHVLATTLSAVEYRRYAAGRKGVQH